MNIRSIFASFLVAFLMTGVACAQPTDPLEGAQLQITANGKEYRATLAADVQTPTTQPAATQPTTQSTTQPLPQSAGPAISVLLTGGVVPATIHVNALTGDNPATDPIRTWYQWDFGDPDSPHNQLTGWNAAHLYARAGKYTITLTTTDAQWKTSVRRVSITIAPDDRRTYYVSSDGNDNANGLSPETAFKTFGFARAKLKANTRILFRRGDTFEVSNTMKVDASNIVVGAYLRDMGKKPSVDDRPILRWMPVQANEFFRVEKTAADVLVSDLCFDSQYGPTDNEKSGASRAVWVSGRNITVNSCTFRNVSDALNAEGRPQGLLVQDCVAPLPTSIRAYLVWCAGSDIVIVGNTVANSTREHIVRTGGCDRLLVANNDFTNLDRTRVADQPDKNDIAKGCVVLQSGSYYYVTGNTVHDGGIGVGPLGGPDGAKSPDYRSRFTVIENNHFSGWAAIGVSPGAEHAMIRNNFIARDGRTAIAVRVTDMTKDAAGNLVYASRGISDICIANNTAVNHEAGDQFLQFIGDTNGQISLLNNVMIAPNFEVGYEQHAIVYVEAADLSAFATIAGNVWPIPKKSQWIEDCAMYVWAKWSDARGYRTPQQWSEFPQVKGDHFETISLGANGAIDAPAFVGVPVPGVFTDINGTLRAADKPWTPGAVLVEEQH